ncbi:MAG: hypothetical protein JSV17_11090 [Candidatus Aminicenantes bacterium]|nr:MAG: hypothetical protein JSV17_11090 [Candidatus Aminicenantes bacterium]
MKALKAIISVFVIFGSSVGIHPKGLLNPSREKAGAIIPKVILERTRSEEGESYVGIRDITVDESSSIYAFDYINYHIKKYDKEGKLLFTFAGTGEEEGKFFHLTGIRAVKDSILAVDSIGLSLFDNSGKFLKKRPYAQEVLVDHPAIFSDGRFVGSQILADEMVTALIYRSADGKELCRLASYEISEFFPGIQKGEDFFLDNTYARAYSYTISPDGDILWASSDVLQINKFGGEESSLLIEEAATAVPFPDELRKPLLERQARTKPPLFAYVPDRYQIVHHLLCGSEGDVWVYVKSREQTGFLRYSKEKKLKGVYAVKADFDVMKAIVRIFNGQMYFVVNERDRVKVYSAELPGHTP